MLRKQALVIHRDLDVGQTVKHVLGQEGWKIDIVAGLAEGLAHFDAHPCPDLVLLGLSAPINDSMDTFTIIHQNVAVPIIVLASQKGEEDCLCALDQGAADYILTPIKVNVLAARVRTVFRRGRRADRQGQLRGYRDGYLVIDLEQGQILTDGEPVRLSDIEYRLLKYLMQNRGRLLTHSQILANVWGWECQHKVEYVHVYASHLRKKLEADPSRPAYLVTEFGVGYRFLPPEQLSTDKRHQTL